jgi:hypothetical protein
MTLFCVHTYYDNAEATGISTTQCRSLLPVSVVAFTARKANIVDRWTAAAERFQLPALGIVQQHAPVAAHDATYFWSSQEE